MDKQRAKQISESPEMMNVTYNGKQVYIQNVNENDTARVYPLDQPENEQDVALTQLEEH
ncbi:H-type small acid-soluble spore protein [Bacillus sp. S/N-304-OC-R1]|uniref:H-type small acid-soluble spore protein n=1 Tax=Bacillus sp. S/N-304-OC-R1 TaxID=2758034 RepID=UPI001C8D8CF4|nr:H-type small acid-soluble spore protein [Bacillus sp. S/N-304-OC-R1]MBY0120476.1 H-type small acid-soluble spore protein [Bacillus sp. S/N-304-OC-R1]